MDTLVTVQEDTVLEPLPNSPPRLDYSDDDSSTSTPVGKQPRSNFDPPIPFGMSRWVVLGLVVYVTIVTGTHPFNWTPWEAILKNQGVFSELCSAATNFADVCEEQQTKIASVLSVIVLAMFSMTFVAGFILDIAGPKTCCLIGGVLLLTGYAMLVGFRKSSTLVFVGFAFVGAGIDPTFFGLLCVANLFPGHEAAVIASLGGFRSLSTVLPVIFKPLVENGTLSLSSVAVVLMALTGAAVAVVVVVSPVKPYRHVVVFPPASAIYPAPPRIDLSHMSSMAVAQTGAATTHVVRHQGTVLKLSKTRTVSDFALQKWAKLKGQVVEAARLVPDPLYWLVVIVSVMNMIRNNWLLSSASKQFTEGAVNYLTILNTVAFIVGPLMGIVVDLWGPIVAMLFLGVTNIATIGLMLMTQLARSSGAVEVFSYLSVSFALPGIGFLLSQIYCYMAVVFPPKHMGKLVGFALICSGLCALVVDPLYSWAQKNNFWTVDLGMTAATVVTTAIIVLLVPLKMRRKPLDQRPVIQTDYSLGGKERKP